MARFLYLQQFDSCTKGIIYTELFNKNLVGIPHLFKFLKIADAEFVKWLWDVLYCCYSLDICFFKNNVGENAFFSFSSA